MFCSFKSEMKGHGALSLLITTLFCLASTNPTPAEITSVVAGTTVLPSETTSSTAFRHAFMEKLENPCVLVNASELKRESFSHLSDADRNTLRRFLLREVTHRASELEEVAEVHFNTSVLCDCASLDLPEFTGIPTCASMLRNNTVRTLCSFYTTLLNHTAHIYFMTEQLRKYSGSFCNVACSQSEASLLVGSETLGNLMRNLICHTKLIIQASQIQISCDDTFFQLSVEQVSNQVFEDQPQCSRRAIRDCQTVKSTVKLLTQMNSFLLGTTIFEDENPQSDASA